MTAPIDLSDEEIRADRIQALKLPSHEYINTVNIEKALEDLRLAEAASPKDQALLLTRAQGRIGMARQNMLSTLGYWRECNRRADELITELLKEDA